MGQQSQQQMQCLQKQRCLAVVVVLLLLSKHPSTLRCHRCFLQARWHIQEFCNQQDRLCRSLQQHLQLAWVVCLRMHLLHSGISCFSNSSSWQGLSATLIYRHYHY
jgi:hypothetical protein